MDQKLILGEVDWRVQTDRKGMKRNIFNEKGGINKDTRVGPIVIQASRTRLMF